MPCEQRYVSDELSHFVGRGKAEDEQYHLLVKILRDGWLTFGPSHDPKVPRTARLDFSKPLSEDSAISCQVVCFCDIPEPDLALHVGKYSGFGLAFKKPFLIAWGACPVFYVANESRVPSRALFRPGDFAERVEVAKKSGRVDRAISFDTSFRALADLFVALDAYCSADGKRHFGTTVPVEEWDKRFSALLGLDATQVDGVKRALAGNAQATNSIAIWRDFLLDQVFSFVKCFNTTLDLNHEANFYMEREWRVAGNVKFTLDDVSRVFFPSKFAGEFRRDLPEYVGQISFINLPT